MAAAGRGPSGQAANARCDDREGRGKREHKAASRTARTRLPTRLAPILRQRDTATRPQTMQAKQPNFAGAPATPACRFIFPVQTFEDTWYATPDAPAAETAAARYRVAIAA